ncbi:zinc-ribbon domain-containing protein [bacterium]|nr:MAG: zinc-ribbon domain-containing protein [bacterium]
MFFFIFGYGPRVKDLGSAGARDCPRCGNNTEWRRAETTNWVSLFFVPVLPLGRTTTVNCPICGHTEAI